jgi:hypothetical protein
MTDQEIESLIGRFEGCSLPKTEWTHDKHLVMALWYLRRNNRADATRLIREGILRYNEAHGNHSGYHETITLAWVAVIARFLSGQNPSRPISELATALLEECGDRNHLLRYYSKDRLFSVEARNGWVPPDIEEIASDNVCPTSCSDHCAAETEPIGLPRMVIPSGSGRAATLKP